MKVESPVKLPAASVPSKCEGVSFDALQEWIDVHSEELSFDKWILAKLEETCMDSSRFDVLLEDLQWRIDKAAFDKTALTTWFYKQTAENVKAKNPEVDSLVDFALYLNEEYKVAKEAGTIESTFEYEGTVPSGPESCGKITEPFVK